MTTTVQRTFGQPRNNEDLEALKYWNGPSGRSARKTDSVLSGERSGSSSAGDSGHDPHDARRVRSEANNVLTLPTARLSQEYQYPGGNQWRGADFSFTRTLTADCDRKTSATADCAHSRQRLPAVHRRPAGGIASTVQGPPPASAHALRCPRGA